MQLSFRNGENIAQQQREEATWTKATMMWWRMCFEYDLGNIGNSRMWKFPHILLLEWQKEQRVQAIDDGTIHAIRTRQVLLNSSWFLPGWKWKTQLLRAKDGVYRVHARHTYIAHVQHSAWLAFCNDFHFEQCNILVARCSFEFRQWHKNCFLLYSMHTPMFSHTPD